jgi:CheY-like chemotaxis protein
VRIFWQLMMMMRVLIADDDGPLRLVTEALVEELGYQPLSASGPAEALACADGGTIDILLTDLDMDGNPQAGIELARELRRIFPDLAVLYASGGGLSAAEQARFVPGSWALPKPYSLDQLAEALDQAVARAPALSAARRIAAQTSATSDASVARAPIDTRTIQRPSVTAGVR